MAKTTVGLFEKPRLVDEVIHDLEASGLPREAIRILGEPLGMAGNGVMSIPHTDFEVELTHDLRAIGAGEADAEAYVQGVRRGGTIIFATDSAEKAEVAAEIMNRHGAIELEELSALEQQLPSTRRDNTNFGRDSSAQAGRVRSSGGGARLFVW